jgi:acetyltransferase-like isoleucine patch superfamily enzyme
LCGNVIIGKGSFVGAGAVIRQGITIGKNAVIGAGAVVVKDVADNTTVLGIPARIK